MYGRGRWPPAALCACAYLVVIQLDPAPGRRAPCGRCPRDLLVSAPCCGDGIMREPGCRVRFHVLVKHSHPCLDRSWRLVTRDKEVCKANSATRPGRGGGGSVHVQRGSCRKVRRSRWFRSSERTSVSNAAYSWAISKDQTLGSTSDTNLISRWRHLRSMLKWLLLLLLCAE